MPEVIKAIFIEYENNILVKSRNQINDLIQEIGQLESTEHICQQLVAIGHQLDGIHHIRNKKRFSNLSKKD
tara:strand:+ start:230 stop:442 length:213 start_codon:yes stop_codon:yes gene_type:complete